MKSHWLLQIAIVIALLHNQAKSKNIGNDIIVNIGQTNGHNYGDAKNGNTHENTQPDSSPSQSAAPASPSKPVKHSASPANFTNAPKETMCSAKGVTLQVEANAVQGHLKAGAKLGSCPKTTAPTTQPVNASSPAPQPSIPPATLPTNSSNNSSSPSVANNSTTPTTSPLSSSSPASPSSTPKTTPPPSTSATPVPETKESVRIPICLPHVNSTIVVPANLLGQFLGKGAKIGNCTAPPATIVSPPPTTTPAPTTETRPAVLVQPAAPTIIQPAQPAIVVRPKPITISSEECVTPRPTVGYRTKPQDNQPVPSGPKPRVNLL